MKDATKANDKRTLQRDQLNSKIKIEAHNVKNHVFVTRRTRETQSKLKI